jgi:diacylglycerol kinase family enzyme
VGNRPLRPTPEADFDSGLALYARRRMSTLGVLFSMARLSGADPRIGARGAHVLHDLDALTVLADEPMPVQVDGDFVGSRSKLTFTATRRALRVIV